MEYHLNIRDERNTSARLRPTELIDARYDLALWWQTPAGLRYMRGFRESVNKSKNFSLTASYHNMPLPIPSTEAMLSGRSPDELCDYYTGSLTDSESYFVADHFVELVLSASRRLKDEDCDLGNVTMPANAGFMYLQRPIYLTDVNGDSCNVHAIQWTRTQLREQLREDDERVRPGIFFTLYSDLHDPNDAAMSQLHAANHEGAANLNRFVLFHMHAMLTDRSRDDWSEDERKVLDEAAEQIKDSTREFGRFMYSMFTIMEQTIKARGMERPTRAQRRRWRKQRPPDPVTIIRLRRVEPMRTDGEGTREWTHQWLVRGHWRTLHRDTSEQRAVWVSPHIKGPEHLPLIVKDHVHVVSR